MISSISSSLPLPKPPITMFHNIGLFLALWLVFQGYPIKLAK